VKGDIFPIDARRCCQARHLFHDDPADDATRLRAGLHVVARHAPMAPDQTVLSLGGCFPRSTAALPNFAEDVALYYERWISVATEDVGILEKQQRGLGSVLYRPARLSWRDDLIQAVHNWVMAQLPDSSPDFSQELL
jgi:hypothetical protein